MGSPLCPMMANTYIEYFEEIAIETWSLDEDYMKLLYF